MKDCLNTWGKNNGGFFRHVRAASADAHLFDVVLEENVTQVRGALVALDVELPEGVVRDENGDAVVGGVEYGEAAVVGLEDEVRRTDPRGGQPSRGELALQVLVELHATTRPVQQLVDVAEQVDGRDDARDHDRDHQQREDDRPPVVPLFRVIRQILPTHRNTNHIKQRPPFDVDAFRYLRPDNRTETHRFRITKPVNQLRIYEVKSKI